MRHLLVAACLVTSCGGGVCADRIGVYEMSLVAESGDCPSEKLIINYGAPEPLPADCIDKGSVTDDSCDVTVDVTCPTFRMTGKVSWSEDGGSGSGRLFYAGACTSVFQVTYTRL